MMKTALTMASSHPGVKHHMLYVKHVLISLLNSNKQAKTVKNAWILEIDFKKNNKPVSVREHDSGWFCFE